MHTTEFSRASWAVIPFSNKIYGDIQIRLLAESFGPDEFRVICSNDPQTSSGRYQDIHGVPIPFIGTRTPWALAMQRAHANLKNLDDDQDFAKDSPY